MSVFILSCSFAEEVVKDKERLTPTALNLALMQPAANTQPLRMMKHRKIILAELMTPQVTRRKLECMKHQKKTMATRLWSSALKRSTQSAVHSCSIQNQMSGLKTKCGAKQLPLGVNTLANMMKKIIGPAGLSKVYTNLRISATAITLWSNAGVTVSGHRNKQSLVHYNSRPSVSQLQNCSDVLSRALSSEVQAFHATPSSRQETSPLHPSKTNDLQFFAKPLPLQITQFWDVLTQFLRCFRSLTNSNCLLSNGI